MTQGEGEDVHVGEAPVQVNAPGGEVLPLFPLEPRTINRSRHQLD